MRNLKNCSKIISVLCCVLLLSFLIISTNTHKTYAMESQSSQNVYLENNKIYMIKNQRSNLYLDVTREETTNGTELLQYEYNGSPNQQFKISLVNGETDVYEIIPMLAENMRVDISGGSTNDNTKVQIYESNSTSSQRFKILDDGNGTGSFKILTGNTNFSKCVTVKNASYSAENIIQFSYYNHGTEDNDHWYFEKVDTIGVNLQRDVNIGMNSRNTFQLDFKSEYIFQNVNYIVETVGDSDTLINLYHNGEFISGNDDGGDDFNARLIFKPTEREGYTVQVFMYDTTSGNAKLRLRPLNQMYANSYNGNINTMQDIYDIYDDMNKLDYYVNHHVNTNPFDNAVFTNTPAINSTYYFISAHGGAGIVEYAPNCTFYSKNLPSMNNVKFVVWKVCHGADAPTTGGNSMVQQSIINGAQYALSWHGSIYVDTSNAFTGFLWENIGNGQTIENAVANAISSTRSKYWIKQLTGWGDDPVLSPVLQSATKSIKTNSYASPVYNNFELNEFDNYLNDTDVYLKFVVSETKTVYVKTINNILTNELTVIEKDENSNSYSKKVLNQDKFNNVPDIDLSKYHNNSAIIEDYYYLYIDGNYHLVQRTQVNKDDMLDEIYYDIINNKYLTEEYIINAFNYSEAII